MKRIIALTALLATANAFSHSMSPITFGGKKDPLKSITMTGYVVVPITVGSHITQDFIITVDDEEIETIKVHKGQRRKKDIPVKLNEPNRVERHEICSIGIGSSVNTRICTQVKAFWLVKEK